MEEARIPGLGVKADMVCNSQANDILQHQDSSCGGTTKKHSLEGDEGSDFITKNRNLVSSVFCTQETREEIPGREARTGPPDGQQDSECSRNKEKTLGNKLCSPVACFHLLLILFTLCPAWVAMNSARLGLLD